MRALSASLDFPCRPATPRKTGLRNGPSRTAATLLGLSALLAAAPASAVTLDNGVVLITQADALAGGVTPGDTPGFPVTLSVSGSYRFASNLLVNASVDGIDVTAPEVTIDMAGFRMAGSGVGAAGVRSGQRALTVRNGTIRGFTFSAMFGVSGLVVDRMRLVDNPIPLSRNQAVVNATSFLSVTNSNLSRNGKASGIGCGDYCRVQNNVLTGTGSVAGIAANGVGAIVTGNTIVNFAAAIVTSGSVSFGDNVMIGNAIASQGTLLPLDPNQPPPTP